MRRLLSLNFRRRITTLVWLQRLIWLPLAAVIVAGISARPRSVPQSAFWIALALFAVLQIALRHWELSTRRMFILQAHFPGYLVDKLCTSYPQLERRDADLVLRGLREFFLAHLRSGRKFVAMPSRLADAAWHEFILHTRAYQLWCRIAFGRLLHHSPAEVLGADARRNDGLRRTWYWACRAESIDPRAPSRLPLLFALDRKYAIPGGFSYIPDCRDINRQAGSGVYCGSEFGASDGASGDAASFGGSESDSGADGGSGDSDGGCGGD